MVGNSASGIDLSSQISAVSQHPLLISEREKPNSVQNPSDDHSTELLPEIAEFLLEDRAVRFINGRIEKDVDTVIFCTGYMYSFPFLRGLNQPIVSTGERTQNLYQQVFYHPIPTLSFIGLPQRIVPLPVSEAQSSVIARVLSGRLTLPSPKRMQAWEEALIETKGNGKSYHTLAFPLDAAYINMLHDWALSTPPNPALPNDGVGKIPPYWGEEKQWIRERFPLIKLASRKLGANRYKITKLEELGFDFQAWKREVGSEKELL